jgi:hypothetical protein
MSLGMTFGDYTGRYLRRANSMTRQFLSQELEIAYYRTMSKIVQFRRNVLKNSISSVQAKILPTQVFAQEAIQ